MRSFIKSALFTSIIAVTFNASADVICLKGIIKKGKVSLSKVTSNSTCPKGYLEAINLVSIQGQTGPQGSPGPQGAPGEDGNLNAYGNGSRGDLIVSSTTNFSDANPQYQNITINSGATISLPSGSILRCTGNLINNGTIFVQTFAKGGQPITVNTNILFPDFAPPHPGISRLSAGLGQYANAGGINVNGGYHGNGIAQAAATLLYPGPTGGGAGAAGGGPGGDGGGTVTILCNGSIQNNGSIIATGNAVNSGAGGGAGGIVILASKTSISNPGTINVKGTTGGDSYANSGAGGGGSGGIVRLISPSITNSGSILLQGGASGSTGLLVNSSRHGGGGGGACGGDGGDGASVNASNQQSGATAGQAGQLIINLTDPTTLL